MVYYPFIQLYISITTEARRSKRLGRFLINDILFSYQFSLHQVIHSSSNARKYLTKVKKGSFFLDSRI